MLSIVINSLLVLHVVVSLLIVLVVLMQRPKNEGLGAAFGGGMTDNLFGAQTTNVLQKFTRLLGGTFFLLTLILSILFAKQARVTTQTDIQRQLRSMPAPAPVLPKVLPNATPASGAFEPGSVMPLASPAPATGMSLDGSAPASAAPAASAPAATAAPTASATPQPQASAQPSPTAAKDSKKQ